MTSSMDESSGKSAPDAQEKQAQPDVQHQSPASGNFQSCITTPPVEYIMPNGLHEVGQTMAQVAYPYVGPYYGMIAAYGGQTAMHPHVMNVIQTVVPLPTDAVEEPVYVNAKQYHGILRRRQSRAKLESENKLVKCHKPYLHESRHLHALKRARGCGGRFLKSKALEKQQNGISQQDKAQHCDDLASEKNLVAENQQNGVPSQDRVQSSNYPSI